MNLEAGFQFIVFITLFGALNYSMMLRRYEHDEQIRKSYQIKKIAKLYPKGEFIRV